ncbi:cytochrome P450 [Favolaschia claudopus]|uniref:Cytochrome P450 n=1 Tax=Favolaschia claudopus TaxID=2862362 RepID=A0AAV9YZK4_9AGAR
MDDKLVAVSLLLSCCLCSYCFLLRRKSIVARIPGPPASSWVFGHMKDFLLPDQYGDFEYGWQREYGPVYRIKGCFGEDRLMVSDPMALQHVLNTNLFAHGPSLEQSMTLVFDAQAVMAAHGETHKRLRAALQVGFSASAVRRYQPLFQNVARGVTERLDKVCALLDSTTPTDILPIMSEASLNSMSQVLMGYSTEKLGKDFVSNNSKVMALAAAESEQQILASAVSSHLPLWCWRAITQLPIAGFDIIRNAKVFAKRVGRKAIAEKLNAAREGVAIDPQARADVFDLLLNIDPTLSKKPPKAALTQEEIASQTGILFIAGEDTTTSALVFALLELADHQQFQDELRAEVHQFAKIKSDDAEFSYDNMPLLNAFIKETLRRNAPGSFNDRAAIVDTVLPLTQPIRISNGEVLQQIPIRKGQIVTVATASYHRNETLWGDDAHEFRPSRWLDGTAYHGRALGPYANLLTFLGGQRVCLGWRFALLEMQVVLFELVGNFRFTPSKDGHRLRSQFANSLMPILPDGNRGAPLTVTRC